MNNKQYIKYDSPQNDHETTEKSSPISFKKGLGVFLLGLGVLCAFWLAYCILNLFQLASSTPENVPIIGALLFYSDGVYQLPDGSIQLPKVFYLIVGFFLYLFALGIIQGLTSSFLSAGSNLLGHELNAISSKLRIEIQKLKDIIKKLR